MNNSFKLSLFADDDDDDDEEDEDEEAVDADSRAGQTASGEVDSLNEALPPLLPPQPPSTRRSATSS